MHRLKCFSTLWTNGIARIVIIQMIHEQWDSSYLASVLMRYPG